LQQAKQIGRYKLDNGQVPDNSTFVPEPMEAELLDVFETISTLVSTFGYPVFEPVSKSGSAAHLFFCRGGGSDGTGELVDDGFVVREGSKARMEIAASAEDYVRPRRNKLIDSGVIEERNGEYVFTQDYQIQFVDPNKRRRSMALSMSSMKNTGVRLIQRRVGGIAICEPRSRRSSNGLG